MKKIIIDTCILYNLGKHKELFERVKDKKICPNWINLRELTTTGNLLKKEQETRAAIQKLFAFQNNVIFMPPIPYMVSDLQEVDFDIEKDNGIIEMLKFTSIIAKGARILPKMANEYIKRNRIIKANGIDPFVKLLNSDIDNFRKKNKDIDKIDKNETLESVYSFFNFLVEATTNKKNTLDGVPYDNFELLAKTFNEFYREKVKSKERVERNDIYDFFILGYVKKGDKFWTSDSKWKKRIRKAGCGTYLFYLDEV